MDVEADDEDRNLLEDFSEGLKCLDDTREAGYSVIKQDLSDIVWTCGRGRQVDVDVEAELRMSKNL